MIALRFLKPWSLYNSGEEASFDAETAETLVASGLAEAATEATPVPKPAPSRKQRAAD